MSGPKHFLSMYGGEVEANFSGGFNPQGQGQGQGQQVNGDELHRRIDRSKIYKFESKASGIILIKQDYKKLFYNPTRKLASPLREVEILFYTRKSSEEDVLKIVLANRRIEVEYLKPQLEGEKVVERLVSQTYETNEILFPTAEEAPLMLQKKVWVELNRLNRSLEIYSGDVVNYKGQKPLASVSFQAKEGRHEGWNNEAEKFELPTYSAQAKKTPLKLIDPFTEIQFFYVNFRCEEAQGQLQEQTKISDYVSLQVLNLGRIFDPVIEENVSLLKPSLANLESMPPPLRNLYECLKNLDIRSLPDFSGGMDPREHSEYLGWRELQFALHHSLVTAHGYSLEGTPLGIMNHLYKMKCKREYRDFRPAATDERTKTQTFLNKDQMLEEIYTNRAGYIRLELLPHEGLGPGSMAVLQVWPPFHCSSIHNHGDAFGLIKVLAGSIRVQNFSELAFSALQGRPYLENDYLEDQYTWLSELSFGIHRLVNVKPQTCFTLQSYYHNEVTEEYFSVVKRINGVHTYIEYYPQNDWVNYLAERDNARNDPRDREFINRVVSRYGLVVNGKLDTSFQRLVLALKKEYEYFHRTLATEFYH